MERVKILVEEAEKFFLEQFSENIKFLQEKMQETQYKEIVEKQYVEMKERTKEKCIVYFGLSFLYSSLYDKSHEVIFSMLDENFYLDTAPIECFVKFPVFFEIYEQNMEYTICQLVKKKGNMQPFEMNEIRKAYALYYYAAIYEFFRNSSKAQFFKEENLIFFCGMYHGEAVQWKIDKDNIRNNSEELKRRIVNG